MRLAIGLNKKTENIEVFSDFQNPDSIGEITQFITELEILKRELIELYEVQNE